MPIEKTLLLKVLAGVAALGSVGGVGGVVIKNKLDERAAEEKKKKEELKDKVNEKLKTLGIEGCDLDISNFTDSTTFSKDCVLDQTKFKKINFSNKDGSNDVNVTGWTAGNKVKLTISNKPGEENGIKFLFKEVKDDLTITKSSTDQTDKFTIKKGKETEFEEKPDNKLKKKVNDAISQKLNGHNTKLGTLSLPASCRFDETEEDASVECEISETEFKKIKFFNKADDSTELTVAGWSSQGNIKLTIERSGAGETETLKYVFKDIKNKLTITGKDNKSFTLKQNVDAEFEFREDVLGRPRKIGESAKKVNLKCTYTTGSKGNTGTCTLEDNKNQISVSSNGSTSAGISFTDGSENAGKKSQVSFDFSEYEYDYEGDVKFTYRGETLNAGVNDEKLEKDASYGIKTVSSGATYWLVKKNPQ